MKQGMKQEQELGKQKLVSTGAKYKAPNDPGFPIQPPDFMPQHMDTNNKFPSAKLSLSFLPANNTDCFSLDAQQPSSIEHAQLPQKPAISRAKCTGVEGDLLPFRNTPSSPFPYDQLGQFIAPYRIVRLLEDAHHIPVKEVLQRYQAKFGSELGIELGGPNASEEEMTTLLRPALPPRLRIIQHLHHFYLAVHPPHLPPYHITRHYPPRLFTLRNRVLRLCSHPVDIATLECMYEYVFGKIEWPMRVWVESSWQPAIENWKELMIMIVENLKSQILKPELEVELLWKDLDGRNVKVPPIFADENNIAGRIKYGPLFERIRKAPKILRHNTDSNGVRNKDGIEDAMYCAMEADDYSVIQATRTRTFKSGDNADCPMEHSKLQSTPPQHPKTSRDGYATRSINIDDIPTPRYTQLFHGIDNVHAVNNVAEARQTTDENERMFSPRKRRRVDSGSGNIEIETAWKEQESKEGREFFSLSGAELSAVGQRTPCITTAANTILSSSSPLSAQSFHNTTTPDRRHPTCSSTLLQTNSTSWLSSDSSATPLTPRRSLWINTWTSVTKSTPPVEMTQWSEGSPIRFPLINHHSARKHMPCVVPASGSVSANSIPLATLPPELFQPVVNQLVVNQPEENQPEVNQPEVNQPEVNQPEQNQPEQNQPEVNQPEVNQPEVNQPEQNQPEVNRPEVNRPEVNRPEVNQPEVNRPEVNRPEVNRPEVNQPEVNQPEQNQPEQNQPEMNQPEVNQPEVNQPERTAAPANFIPSGDSAKGRPSFHIWQCNRYFTLKLPAPCIDAITVRKQVNETPASAVTSIDWNFIPLDDSAKGPLSRSWKRNKYLRNPHASTKFGNAITTRKQASRIKRKEKRERREREKEKDKAVDEKQVE
ncbi:hypothetical protein BC937DRAFT_86163 [Endogone sp. FLAS-F59071]|nr:hypothetical protein BC937DRAFT_86163 [Endogone sp. FLAS-F59071]|eukprot:RUS22869.1 hypothetical protein BC937DRAFT_86163 [Endogone sp. FLAS-F59071]